MPKLSSIDQRSVNYPVHASALPNSGQNTTKHFRKRHRHPQNSATTSYQPPPPHLRKWTLVVPPETTPLVPMATKTSPCTPPRPELHLKDYTNPETPNKINISLTSSSTSPSPGPLTTSPYFQHQPYAQPQDDAQNSSATARAREAEFLPGLKLLIKASQQLSGQTLAGLNLLETTRVEIAQTLIREEAQPQKKKLTRETSY